MRALLGRLNLLSKRRGGGLDDDARQRFRSLYDDSVPAFNSAMAVKGMARIGPVKEILPEFPKEKEKKADDEDE